MFNYEVEIELPFGQKIVYNVIAKSPEAAAKVVITKLIEESEISVNYA